jgi:hypothetical protein
MRTPMVALASSMLMFTLLAGGCYKSDFEREKKQREEGDAKIADLTTQLATARQQAEAANAKLNQFGGIINARARGPLKLATIANGTVDGTDEIEFDPSLGAFVRNGVRQRQTSAVKYERGRIADQVITISRSNGKPYITGATKGGSPDGEWLWYNADGKETNKEVWKEGKLVELWKATGVKDGKPSWTQQSKGERDSWFASKANLFMNFPELTRALGAAPTPPPPAPKETKPAPAKTPAKPAR